MLCLDTGGWANLYKSSTGLCSALLYDVSSPGTEPAAAAAGGGEVGESEQPRARPPPSPAGTAGPPSLPPGRHTEYQAVLISLLHILFLNTFYEMK